ncbi:MAG: SPFH domain-containing protein [Microcoleaceae cyanobacterium]
MGIIIALIAVLGAGTGAGLFIIRNLYYICQPSEVLIFAGSRHPVEAERDVGYRLVKGGSSLRVPLLEQAFRMDLTNMIIELKVANAYSKGGIPLAVEGVANIKIAGEEPTIHNAIERLLGKSRKQIEQMAKDTLEGNLRGVLASLTPEQVNGDKLAFAKSLLEEAEDDLEKLGLILDTLQIQNISDDVNYLNSIGRKQRAELLRDARIAEAKAQAQAAIRSAENHKKTASKQLETETEMAKAEAERRVQDAITKRNAVIAESESEIASEVARTQAELAVQKERIKQVQQQLIADVVAPAEANCQQAIEQAKGNAAKIIEDGKAQAEGTKKLAESWQAAGSNAREIFLYQKLEVLLKTLVSTVPEVQIDNVTVISDNNNSTAAKTAKFLEELQHTTGINVAETLNNLGGKSNGSFIPNQTVKLAAVPQPRNSINPVDPQSLQSLKSDVEQFLDKIATNTENNLEAEQKVQQTIQQSPKFKRQLQKVLQVGGQETLKAIFNHPTVYIPTAMLIAWLTEE